MRLGKMGIRLLDDGLFRLDGGAMFGIVPRALWERTNPSDESNRIDLRAGALLIQSGGKNILVDAGLGTKLNTRLLSIYDFKGSRLLQALADLGLTPDDIHEVVFTHLHLDHAGGATYLNESNRAVARFPEAEYVVQEREWEAATAPNELTKGSYVTDDFFPLEERGALRLVDGDCQLADGIELKLTGGHTEGHQIVLLESNGEKAVFLGDLIPTTSHLKLPYVMSYDLFPLKVLEEKRALIERALQENWLLIWGHDPKVKMGYLYREKGRILVREPQGGRDE